MALSQENYTNHVAARIEEYVDDKVPWQRSLWQLGTVLALKEVVEYADQFRRGAIREEGLKYACHAVKDQCAKDPAVATTSNAGRLDELLRAPKDLKSEYLSAQLEHLADRVGQGYLSRWASVLQAGGTPPSAERTSRFIASHLLDAELSPDATKAWLRGLRESEDTISVSDLCESADQLLAAPPRKFAVIIPFRRFPRPESRWRASSSSNLSLTVLDEASARDKVGNSASEFDVIAGGIQVQVTARDAAAAVAHTQELLSRLLARLSVSPAHATAADLHDRAVVTGIETPYPLSQQRRLVRLPSIDVSRSILKVKPYAEADALDDALELLAYFDQGTPGAALTGGWAALESLLVLPSEQAFLAADRLAAIVACDFPRAELTWLVHAPLMRRQTDQSVLDAVRSSTVTERVQRFEQALAGGASVTFVRPADVAGLSRIQELLADPADGLHKIQRSVTEALRRLYAQRNVVMHAGSLASVTRRATLRSVPSLAGAGMDRLVLAASLVGVTPLKLAARAEAELRLLPSSAPDRPLCQLLM
ncbi:hypothetical protein ACIODS_24340 [Micromonospora chalcea]|uniref:hypothetical protein n=1 Tax=Micromonospora chalcea TaxID=1874 RepID=UPI0037F26BC5